MITAMNINLLKINWIETIILSLARIKIYVKTESQFVSIKQIVGCCVWF